MGIYMSIPQLITLPYKDPEKRRICQKKATKKYRSTESGREHVRVASRKYHKTHRDKMNEYQRDYIKIQKVRDRINNYRRNIRIRLMNVLGSKCVRCNTSDLRVLQIDHINGGGIAERRQFGDYRLALLHYMKDPDLAKEKLQLLCANCHVLKTGGF